MHKFDKFLFGATWAYLASTILALLLAYVAGDRWWPGTLLLFGPRWALALPIIPLLPLILWRRPVLLIPLALGAAMVFGPLMGFRYSFSTPQSVEKSVVRVVSCNVGGKNFDAQKLSQLIQDFDVDIVSLQECPRDLRLELAAEWNVASSGNLSVFSKYSLKTIPLTKDIAIPGRWPVPPLFQCMAATPFGDILVYAVHLPTARYGLENMLDSKTGLNFKKTGYLITETQRRLHISQEARNAVRTKKLPFVIAGDFNMPVESTIYRQHWGEFHNAFSYSGRGYGFTTMNIHKKIPIPLRIDHILTSNGLAPLVCKIGPDVGSDHRPLIADVAWK